MALFVITDLFSFLKTMTPVVFINIIYVYIYIITRMVGVNKHLIGAVQNK